MLANYHTHTVRCNHAEGTEREYIEAAIENGFKTLGFSDHVPQPYPERYHSGMRMRMDEIPDYTGTLVKLREEYKDSIEILIGYEVEYSDRFFEPMLKELRKYPFDYMIMGQHFAPDEINGRYMGNDSDDEGFIKSYADTVVKGLKTGLFTYLAHPDLVKFTGDEKTYKKHMERIIATSIDMNIPLEVNLYGFTDHRHYPSDRFFSFAKEMGASFIIGCDAHTPKLLKQPEAFDGFTEFLNRNGIDCGDNTVTLKNPK